jgi:hypothetical protein
MVGPDRPASRGSCSSVDFPDDDVDEEHVTVERDIGAYTPPPAYDPAGSLGEYPSPC